MNLTENQLKAKLREAFIAGGRYYTKGVINSPMPQEIKKAVKNAKGFDMWFSEFDTNKHTSEANLNIPDVVGSVLCECEKPSRKRNGCCRICGGEII